MKRVYGTTSQELLTRTLLRETPKTTRNEIGLRHKNAHDMSDSNNRSDGNRQANELAQQQCH